MILLFPAIMVYPQPATISGNILNSSNSAPVTGAKVQIGNVFTYSVSGGSYSLQLPSGGTYQISASKTGFNTAYAQVALVAGSPVTQNLSLFELTNAPGNTIAYVDSILTPVGVKVEWQLPEGPYEILTDDGTQENFTVWSSAGNMNALKFTPAAYPVKITGGKINIGTLLNYPAGSTPLVPFQVWIYNDSGAGGVPGNIIAGPFDVLPSDFGWVDFNIANPPVLNNGNFYIVMVQGGNAPNAAGLAVDATTPGFRSYSKFGNNAWVPANGNFMIRALVEGPGGPLYLQDSPESLLNFSVYRLKQGEELNPAVWTLIGSPDVYKIVDYSWITLPCGPYRWGVRANYSGNRTSTVTFSNIIGKCWTKSVSIHVDLSCTETPISGTKIIMRNLVYPDTLYTSLLVNSNEVTFPQVWKGSYEIEGIRFGYQQYSQPVSVSTDTAFSILLLQEKTPPEFISINDSNLLVRWAKPRPVKTLLSESWTSGSFLTNGWTTAGGPNWGISAASGNPAPSAIFSYSPPAAHYSQELISQTIQGENSAVLKLDYDIFLDNYGTTTVNQMAVELWDGSSWHLLKNYSNAGGDITWTAQELDISMYTDISFQIRFRAYGEDSYDINYWSIDNINVIASESEAVAGSCVLGYNISVNNILCGFTTDTSYFLPQSVAVYGQVCQGCVNAVYASGPSSNICETFVSHYLFPPENFNIEPVDDAAFLSWNNPQNQGSLPPGLNGFVIYKNGIKYDSVAAGVLEYYDYGLYPGTYTYSVSANYDLAAYGFTGTAESSCIGPRSVLINYGRPLPFFEGWDNSTFSFNSWTFPATQGNWNISNVEGFPPPAAVFEWEPIRTSYSYAVESTIINATSVSCSKIWLDVNLKLTDLNSTGSEVLSVELFYNDSWHTLEDIYSLGSTDWETHHLDISAVKGKAFRVRFRAHGQNSADIERWEVDNIHIYAVCKAPRDLTGVSEIHNITLTWAPPVCEDGFPLNEGFEENDFPPVNWGQIINNSSASWFHSDASQPGGVHSGNYSATVSWDYTHQNEWLIANDVLVTGDLIFWSNAFQGSVHQDHYYVKVSDNNGSTWNTLLDLSALPPYPSSNGYNQWNTPYIVDLSQYMGEVVEIAWQAIDGDAQGLWYSWSVDDCTVGGDKVFPDQALSFAGYDIYRRDNDSGPFNKINSNPVPATTYTDQGLTDGSYQYYITISMEECSSSVTTDTLLFDVITGTGEKVPSDGFKIYPNPASGYFIVESPSPVFSVDIIDINGRIISHSDCDGEYKTKIIVNNLSYDFYFVRVTSQGKINMTKLLLAK